jgi:acyl carrier protein
MFFLRRFAMLTTEDDIKRLIVDVLQLEDTTPADIDVEAPLFGDGLGLDSIDALELGVAIQRRYGVVLSANSEENRRHFASVRALASMVDNHRKNGDG